MPPTSDPQAEPLPPLGTITGLAHEGYPAAYADETLERGGGGGGGGGDDYLRLFTPTGGWRHEHAGMFGLLSLGVLVLLPLSFRSLRGLGATSSLVVALYLYIACVVLFGELPAPQEGAHHQHHRHNLWPVLRSLPTMAYCFSSQAIYPPVLESVQNSAGARRLSRILTDSTSMFTLGLYLLMGVCGSLRHAPLPGPPPPNILDAYLPSWWLSGARLALILALSLSFPVMLLVARVHLLSLVSSPAPAAEPAPPALTVGMVLLALLVAICYPQVEVCLGLLGATCSVSLSFIIPALLYKRFVHAASPHAPPLLAPGERGARWEAILPCGAVRLLIGFGIAVAAISIPVQLIEMAGTGGGGAHAGAGRHGHHHMLEFQERPAKLAYAYVT